MPRYYCDYCDTHLTHDSCDLPKSTHFVVFNHGDFAQMDLQPSVRKQHNAGYKHKANVREYYQQFEQLQTQSLIDQKIKEHLGQTGMYQIGAAFNQHLATLPGFQGPRPPVLPPPGFQIPGGVPSQLVPGFRPPVLPRPGVPGYGMPPQMAPIPGQPPIASTLPMQVNGMPLPRPPTVGAPDGMPTPSSSGAPPGITQAMYQPNATGGPPPPASAPTDSYAYAPAPGASR